MEDKEKAKQPGMLTKLWNTHGKVVKYLSLGGLLMTTAFLPSMIVETYDNDPNANVLDVGINFYTAAADRASENLLPALDITFNGVANLVADTIIPGAGTAISAITYGLS